MKKRIFIASTERKSGKSLITIGLMNAFLGHIPKVGYMKPVGQRRKGAADEDSLLISRIFDLGDSPDDINPVSMEEVQKDRDKIFDRIYDSCARLDADKDLVVFEGTDFNSAISALEFDLNAELAKNLSAPVLLVARGAEKTVEEIVHNVVECAESFRDTGCDFLGTIVNMFESSGVEKDTRQIEKELKKENIQLFGTVLANQMISGPRLNEVVGKLGARVLDKGDDMSRIVTSVLVLAMTSENALKYMIERDGALLITPGDRTEHIYAAIIAQRSKRYPTYSGLLLTGGLVPGKGVQELIDGVPDSGLTILSVDDDTLKTALKVNRISGELSENDAEKLSLVFRLVERYVNIAGIEKKLGEIETDALTPRMFQYRIIQTAKAEKQRIVLPEGNEERIIQAAAEVLGRGICDITLIGERDRIEEISSRTGANIEAASIVDTGEYDPVNFEKYTKAFYELRKHKGISRDIAAETILDPVYYATMMVKEGDADGFVSGSVHSTAHTLGPVLRVIRTKEGVALASSIFFMCMPEQVLVYGDCALVENPDAEQLADIAITSAGTAELFGIKPYVALLSYSTGESGKGRDVDKVREAARIAREKRPDIPIEGPMQYDAATSVEVARTKTKDSSVAGRATVFIFPDLDAGNTAYKAVQRSAGVPAIGPIMQGLKKPANDLSRGASVTDIMYTIAVTAVQAQQVGKNRG